MPQRVVGGGSKTLTAIVPLSGSRRDKPDSPFLIPETIKMSAGVSCPDSNAPQTHTQVIDSVHACTTLAQSRPCPVE
ncbi:hypothetical protein C0Q70_13577 [Pomacea canaliculata]|uniref:Uncharacterized protein n=1 Tax=Pomacea canaliculata TaxID=400727 RepID=A0A2T7NXP2_POMCA|nr:hypothetical protein C0Q70_13577 [Pomacea canaliculata]